MAKEDETLEATPTAAFQKSNSTLQSTSSHLEGAKLLALMC